MCWETEKDKFGVAGLTPQESIDVQPPRILECPIQLEATLQNHYPFAQGDPHMGVAMSASEVRISRVHVDESLLCDSYRERISADSWDPLIMKFLEFFGQGVRVGSSRLAEVPQESWAGRKPEPVPGHAKGKLR